MITRGTIAHRLTKSARVGVPLVVTSTGIAIGIALQYLPVANAFLQISKENNVEQTAYISICFSGCMLINSFFVGLGRGISVVSARASFRENVSYLADVVSICLLCATISGFIGVVVIYYLYNYLATQLDASLSSYHIDSGFVFTMITPFMAACSMFAAILNGMGAWRFVVLSLFLAAVTALLWPRFHLLIFEQINAIDHLYGLLSGCIVSLLMMAYTLPARTLIKAVPKRKSDFFRLRSALQDILKIGLPSALQQMIFAVCDVALITLISKHGPEATSAYGLANQIGAYLQIPFISLGVGTSILVTSTIAKENRVVKSDVTVIVALGIAVVGLLTSTAILICVLASDFIRTLFTHHGYVSPLVERAMYVLAPSYALLGISGIFSGAMRGCGFAIGPAAITISSLLLIQLPAASVMSYSYGATGIWYSFAICYAFIMCLQAMLYVLHLRTAVIRP